MRCILTLCTALSVLLSAASISQADEIRLNAQQIRALGIETSRPLADHAATGISLPAQVVIPNANIHIISPSVTGLIEQVLVNAGDHVKAGQPLLIIRSAELSSLQRDYLLALLQDQLAIRQKTRDDQLLQDGIIAASRQQQTSNQAAIQHANLQDRQQSLRLAGMSDADIRALAKSHQLDNRLVVRSLVNASVLETTAMPGERRDMNAPLMKLATLDNLWLEIQLPVTQATNLPIGTRLIDDSGQLHAVVTAIVNAANPGNQTVTVRARISAPDSRVPGSYINVHAQTLTSGWLIPASAIISKDAQTLVFVRSAHGFRTVPVSVLETNDQQARVSGKLSVGDAVVIRGTVAIKATWTGTGSGGE